MGSTATKYFEGKIPYKRLRLNLNPTFRLIDSKSNNQVSPFDHSVWENLPYVALFEIYRYLPDKDKFNMSLTCKAWSEPFSRPEVWRYAKFSFDGIEDWRALRFADSSLASCLRHLKIERQINSIQDLPDDKPQANGPTYPMYTFLDTLMKRKDCQLITLKLINIQLTDPLLQQDTEFDLFKVLLDFLSTQTKLKVLELTNAGFNSVQGIKILSQAALCNASTLKVLSINEMFSSVDKWSFNNCLQSFTNISELTISYQYMSDYLLDILSFSGSLKRLSVFVPKIEESGVLPTSSNFWRKLKWYRPSLEAHYYIEESMQFLNDLIIILVPGIPLVSLEFGCNYMGTFWYVLTNHIARYFKNYLRRLHIKVRLDHNEVYGLLDMFFANCRLLKEIHITDVNRVPGLQAELTRFVRDRLSQPTAIQLHRFTIDGVVVSLERNYFGYVMDLWHVNLMEIRYRWSRMCLMR